MSAYVTKVWADHCAGLCLGLGKSWAIRGPSAFEWLFSPEERVLSCTATFSVARGMRQNEDEQ